MLVAEAMTNAPVTVTPSTTVAKAAQAMRDNDIGDVLVVDRSGHVRGIVTDRDIVVRVLAEGKSPKTTKVSDACSGELTTVGPMESTEHAEELMREHAIRRLPVCKEDDQTLMGVLSLGDLAMREDRDSAVAEISKAPPNN